MGEMELDDMDPGGATAVRLARVTKFAEQNDAMLNIDRIPDKSSREEGTPEWSVAVVWGREASDSPMAAAASYGVGDSLSDAVGMVYDELRLEERNG